MFVLILKVLKSQKSWILKLNILINILTFFSFTMMFLVKSPQSSSLGILVAVMYKDSGWEIGKQFKFILANVIGKGINLIKKKKTTTKVILYYYFACLYGHL